VQLAQTHAWAGPMRQLMHDGRTPREGLVVCVRTWERKSSVMVPLLQPAVAAIGWRSAEGGEVGV
jgi:hypothetical protein